MKFPYIVSFLISKLVHFVCIYVVWTVCMSVLLDMYLVPAEARRSTRFLGTGVTEDRELPCGSW